jgi:hypothetical protein
MLVEIPCKGSNNRQNGFNPSSYSKSYLNLNSFSAKITKTLIVNHILFLMYMQ